MEILRLALRYLVTRKIALVALFAIAVGVMAMIVVVSLMSGVEGFLKDHIKGTQADLVVRHLGAEGLGSGHAGAISASLQSEMEEGGPIAAIAPRREVHALIAAGDHPDPAKEDVIKGVRVLGVDLAAELKVMPLDRMFGDVGSNILRVPVEDRSTALATKDLPAILLGDSLAEALGVARTPVPDRETTVTLVTARARPTSAGGQVFEQERCRSFRVAGCFTTGREDFDAVHVFVDRRELLRALSDHPNDDLDANQVHVRLKPGIAAATVLSGLARRHPELMFQSWETESSGELLALQDQKRIMLVILSFIIAVASVAILGIVYLMVAEKTRDIGILRSMGIERWRIVMVFTVYGLILGLAGCVIGVILGLQVSVGLDGIVAWLSDLCGVKLLDPKVYRFKTVPTRIDATEVLAIAAGAAAMSLIASLLPSLRAGFLSPVRCLKSE